jgi:hypothetical protein
MLPKVPQVTQICTHRMDGETTLQCQVTVIGAHDSTEAVVAANLQSRFPLVPHRASIAVGAPVDERRAPSPLEIGACISEIRSALLAASHRGVDVRILLPERSNHVVADWLSRGFYGPLLRGGVRLFLYQAAMVHAKTATIDGAWTTIGTANIDRLSLTGNYGINVEFFDADLAKTMEEVFRLDCTNARELTEAEWSRRAFMARFCESVLAPLRPLL